MLQRKIKLNLNNWNCIPCSLIRRVNFIRVSEIPIFIYSLIAVTIKISTGVAEEIYKVNAKIYQNAKDLEQTKLFGKIRIMLPNVTQ